MTVDFRISFESNETDEAASVSDCDDFLNRIKSNGCRMMQKSRLHNRIGFRCRWRCHPHLLFTVHCSIVQRQDILFSFQLCRWIRYFPDRSSGCHSFTWLWRTGSASLIHGLWCYGWPPTSQNTSFYKWRWEKRREWVGETQWFGAQILSSTTRRYIETDGDKSTYLRKPPFLLLTRSLPALVTGSSGLDSLSHPLLSLIVQSVCVYVTSDYYRSTGWQTDWEEEQVKQGEETGRNSFYSRTWREKTERAMCVCFCAVSESPDDEQMQRMKLMYDVCLMMGFRTSLQKDLYPWSQYGWHIWSICFQKSSFCSL